MTAVVTVGMVEACRQSEGEVSLACLQVVEGFLRGFEADDIGDVQLLQQLLDQVDVKAFRLTFVVEKRVGPQILRVFIYQRVLLGVDRRFIWLCGSVGDR